MKLFSRIAFVASVTVLYSSIAIAQVPDPNIWGGGVTNPDGSTAVPLLCYDPITGLMWVDTAGLNRMIDTTSGQLIGGDDVGMISLSIEGPAATSVLLNGFVNQPIGGVVWNGQYFNGKQQLFGVGAGAEFLQPAFRTDVFQYPAGLSYSEFGIVEMAVNFAAGQPGATMFGSVFCIPEPAPLGMVSVACLASLVFFRRR